MTPTISPPLEEIDHKTGKIDDQLKVKRTSDSSKLIFNLSGKEYRLLRFEKQAIFSSKWIVLAPGPNEILLKDESAKTAADAFFILYEDGDSGFVGHFRGHRGDGPVQIKPPYPL